MTPDLLLGLGLGLFIGTLGTLVGLEMLFDTGPSEILRGRRRMVYKAQVAAEHWVHPEHDPSQDEAPARLIDPANPPTWRVYAPKDDRPPVNCHCHDRPFAVGQPVMWWPVPDGEPGQVDLMCEEGVGMEAPVS